MADIDPQFLAQVQQFEGFNPNPYGDYHQTSIGYGTKAPNGMQSGPISQADATTALQNELGNAQSQVQAFASKNGITMTPGQQNALTSLTYNAGPGWMQSGLGSQVAQGNWPQAAQTLQQYSNAGGQPNAGLAARRATEASWMLPQSSSTGATAAAPTGLLGLPTGQKTASANAQPATGLLGLPTQAPLAGLTNSALASLGLSPSGSTTAPGGGSASGSGGTDISKLLGQLGSSGNMNALNQGTQQANQQAQQSAQQVAQLSEQAAQQAQARKRPLSLQIPKLI